MENKKLKRLIEEATLDNSWREKFQFQLDNEETEDFLFELSLRIVMRLEELGWTKSKLAEELNVTKQYVSKLLRSRENLSITTIFKIQNVLGMKLIEIPKQNKNKERLQITIQLQPETKVRETNTINLNSIKYSNHKQFNNSKWLKEENLKSKSHFPC
jgi:transcriptional regulator with XRE-family HTH domain